MKELNVYLYKTPGTNKTAAQGILQGVEEFVKFKLDYTPKYHIGQWAKIEKKNQDYLNIFFTYNAVVESKISRGVYLTGNLIFLTPKIADLRNYSDDVKNMNYLKELKGKIIGYNKMAKLLNLDACTNEHCVFNFDKKELDTLSFLLHLNQKYPLCRKHRDWHL